MSLGLNYKSALHTDTSASLATAGVLGDTFVDLDSAQGDRPAADQWRRSSSGADTSLSDVIKSSRTTINQVNVILAKVNAMADALGTSKGSLGLFINNPDLYKHAVGTLTELQGTITKINHGQGTLGKLVADDELYKRANDTVARLQDIVNQVDAGKGTVGKLVKDPALYNNVNQTAENANQLIAEIDAGKGRWA